jgi:DNA-binding CsgD family transcriptional regulator
MNDRDYWIYMMIVTRAMSSVAIAKALGMNESNVRDHIQAIVREKGVRNRVALIAQYWRKT